MRHLRVPSPKTSEWRDLLSSESWLAEGLGIHNLGDFRGIPLNQDAPNDFDGMEIIDLEPLKSGPKHWTERLDEELFSTYSDYWPMSHDQIGDVVIIKIPNEVLNYSEIIGEAILKQHESVRVVCADKGVKGDFRVRDLEVLAFNKTDQTETKVRENGNEFFVDPGVAYYSPRLANERMKTVSVAAELSQKLGRKIDVCDPYAGVGPAVIPLAKLNESVDRIFASDLNPSAALLLAKNLPNRYTECRDALTLHEELPQCCDLLLVNLPHNTLEHLEHVIPLLKSGHLVCIRGWAIVSTDRMNEVEKQVRNSLKNCKIQNISIESSKSYSPKHKYISINVELER